MKIFAHVLFTILVCSPLGVIAFAENEIGVSTYPNATEMPEATARLMETKAPMWIAARAYQTNDSIKNVVNHFRAQAANSKKPAGNNEFIDRLLLDNWKITEGTVSSANVVFGVHKQLAGIAKEKAKTSFGTILLDDSYVRVHIMTPYPVPPAGMTVADGTMIVLIRERVPNPADTSASADADEPVYTGKEVTRKARLRSKPHPNASPNAHGTVVLKAVFGSSGKVTRIVIVQAVPGLTEECIKAARQITFDPAIKDGRYVAQWVQLEYAFW
jgi:hypothetical protein